MPLDRTVQRFRAPRFTGGPLIKRKAGTFDVKVPAFVVPAFAFLSLRKPAAVVITPPARYSF
jgi:hypothetical protein